VNYFFSLDVNDPYLAKRRCEEIPFQLQQNAKWNELANFLSDISNFKLLLGEDMKMDLYKYWKETSQYVPQIEGQLVRGLKVLIKGKHPIDIAIKAGEFLQDIAAYNSAGMLPEKI
jgi:hypothetical protein